MLQLITLTVISALTVIDRLIKDYISFNVSVGDSCFALPHFVEIRYVRNYGGMMGTFDGMARLLAYFTVIVIAAGIIVLMLGKIKGKIPYACVTAIISGGIGNLIDRLQFGYVIDYINVLFVKFYVFNFADCLVTVGVFVLVIYEIYGMIKDSKSKGKGENNA